jgi:hypothetical protein
MTVRRIIPICYSFIIDCLIESFPHKSIEAFVSCEESNSLTLLIHTTETACVQSSAGLTRHAWFERWRMVENKGYWTPAGAYSTLQRNNAKNSKQIFPEKEYQGLSPNFHIMCLWANYIFPRWSCRFCWRKYVDRSWEYINRSQTHECRNWGWGRAIPRKGIYKRNYLCSV